MRGFTSFTDLRPDPKNSMIKQGNNDPPSFESHEYKWHEKNIFLKTHFMFVKRFKCTVHRVAKNEWMEEQVYSHFPIAKNIYKNKYHIIIQIIRLILNSEKRSRMAHILFDESIWITKNLYQGTSSSKEIWKGCVNF